MIEPTVADRPLLVVVGPTATGKTALALRAASVLAGEVVGADSVQVYRGFDIGSGKPTPEELGGVPHHLIDVLDPLERCSAARFVELADPVIAELLGRGKLPVVAGGTGLYVRALVRGLFDAPAPDAEIRRRHRAIRDDASQGMPALRRELELVDPAATARILPNDFVRTSRALEVFEQTRVPISELHAAHGFARPRYPAVMVGIDPGREALRERIERRVDAMIARGWVDEVQSLLARGYGEAHAMGALGYRHLHAHLRAELDLGEAVRQTKRDTWRFAKRQLNWFRSDPQVEWHESADAVALEPIAERLAGELPEDLEPTNITQG